MSPRPPSTALLTDQYELTMLDGILRSGRESHRAVFEVFARHLGPGRRYGVLAGTERLLDAVAAFRFNPDDVEWLASRRTVGSATLDWLKAYRFSGRIDGFAEGELYFPESPVLTVEAGLGEALLLETLVLSVLNHDSAVASAAARMTVAARGTALIEMGSRRTHELAAVDAARAAYVAGFASTSNLEAGERYGIPTTGTAAHAFVLAYPDERGAFDAQLAAQGTGTTLLVDTYDTDGGIRTAVEACRAIGSPGPGAVRLDSGDLLEGARRACAQLDRLGATATRVVVSGDLDEFAIADLERAPGGRAPIDAYGVGTKVVTGSGLPTAELIYKLVAVADVAGGDAPLRPVAKRSVAKGTVGGRKSAVRLLDGSGLAVADEVTVGGGVTLADRVGVGGAADRVGVGGAPIPDHDGSRRPLQRRLMDGGQIVDRPSLEQSRDHCRSVRDELPSGALAVEPGPAALEVRRVPG
jgi:nicotinate phosphoribosyltransferase